MTVVGKGTALSRAVARLCTLMLVISLVTVLPSGHAVGGGLFADVSGHWAEQAITRMSLKGVVKGYDDGSFQPNVHVNRLQTIVMLVRVLGLEDQVAGKAIPASFNNPEFIPDWAKGYVALAVERGIIAGSDLTSFRPTDPATRLEAAVFIVRMLGWADEAQSRTGASLTFTDAASIPSALRGFVAIACEEDLLRGMPDGSFRPSAAITRAEFVTIMSRVDSTIPGYLEDLEVQGTLSSVAVGTTPTIGVRADGVTTTYTVSPDVHVYYRENKISLSSLIVGDGVTIVLDDQGRVVYIESYPPITVTSGTVLEISAASVTVSLPGGQSKVFPISDKARIRIDGRTVAPDQLSAGHTVTIKEQNGEVVLIEAMVTSVEAGGVIVGYIPGPPALITIRSDDKATTFRLAQGVIIKRDGVDVDLESLRVGDGIVIYAQGDIALRIEAWALDRDFTGTFKEIALVSPPTATVTTDTGDVTYPFGDTPIIMRNNTVSSMTSLRPGDLVTVRVRGGVITRIDATAVIRTENGTIQAVYIAAEPQITIKLLTGEEKTYAVDSSAIIRMGTQRLYLNELKPGYLVEIRLEGSEVVRIDVEAVKLLEDIKGTVEFVVSSANVLVISPEGAGPTQTKEVHVTDLTVFIRNNVISAFNKIQVGDRVLVVGDSTTGVFSAVAVIVLSVTQ